MLYIVFIVCFILAFLIGGLVGFGLCLKAGEANVQRMAFTIAHCSHALDFLDCDKIAAHGMPDVASGIRLARAHLDAVVDPERMILHPSKSVLDNSPHRTECSWCGALISEGVEPVSHGCCDRCLPDVLSEIEGLPRFTPVNTGRSYAAPIIGENPPAPRTTPAIPPPPPPPFYVSRPTNNSQPYVSPV